MLKNFHLALLCLPSSKSLIAPYWLKSSYFNWSIVLRRDALLNALVFFHYLNLGVKIVVWTHIILHFIRSCSSCASRVCISRMIASCQPLSRSFTAACVIISRQKASHTVISVIYLKSPFFHRNVSYTLSTKWNSLLVLQPRLKNKA